MRLPALGARLEAVAALIAPGSRLIDIGTDHALLPVILLSRGAVQRAAAIDLRSEPLARGKKNAERFGVALQIEFVQGDGLAVPVGDGDVVVIAGLGGRTVARIVCESGFKGPFILAAHNGLAELRLSLAACGYAIEKEVLALENERVYVILLVRQGGTLSLSPAEAEIGPVLLTKLADGGEAMDFYIKTLRKRLKKRQLSNPALKDILALLPDTEC